MFELLAGTLIIPLIILIQSTFPRSELTLLQLGGGQIMPTTIFDVPAPLDLT